jgi:hypothetical protein
MSAAELAFYTCEELITELMSRTTFYGCVIRSAEDHKHPKWDGRTFRVHFNENLDRARAGRLLDTLAGMLSEE